MDLVTDSVVVSDGGYEVSVIRDSEPMLICFCV
jgi:hypothetical protein